jgi:hypothetical protein
LYDGLSEKSAKFYLTLMSNGVVVVWSGQRLNGSENF